MAVSQEAFKRERAVADFMVGGNLLDDPTSVKAAKIAVNVGQDFLFSFFLKDYLATERRIDEASLNFFPDVARMSAYEGLKAILITELGTRMANKVEYGKMVLSLVQTESSANCWRKTVALSVGRRNRMVSISGMSTPSLKRSTTKR